MNFLKRLLIGLVSVAVLFAFSGEAMAVSKKTKKEESKKVVAKQKPDAKKPAPKATKQPAKKPSTPAVKKPAQKATKPPKKYDDFVDKNNNGIDDRKEKRVPKPAKQDKDKKTEKKKK